MNARHLGQPLLAAVLLSVCTTACPAGNTGSSSGEGSTSSSTSSGMPPSSQTASGPSSASSSLSVGASSAVAPSSSQEPGPPNACLPPGSGPGFKVSARPDLRWKRARSLELDLMAALELKQGETCSELGFGLAAPGLCFNLIHQVPLGSNDPVHTGLYRPMEEPGATTALAMDRVFLGACGQRVDVDASLPLGQGVVFRHLNLAAQSVDPEDAALAQDVRELFHRLLAREPTAKELLGVGSLAVPVDGVPVPARDVAKMACYAVASMTEFIFH